MKKNILKRLIAISLIIVSILAVSVTSIAEVATGKYNKIAVYVRSTIGGTSIGKASKGTTCNILDEQTVGGVTWYKVYITSHTSPANGDDLYHCTGWSQAQYITRTNNVQPTGIQSATDAFGTRNLAKGSKGNYVRNLQLCLCQKYSDVVVDGDFGNKTDYALRKFQREYLKVTDDGICGPNTRNAIWNYQEGGKYIFRDLLMFMGY